MNAATGELIAVKQVRINTTEEQEQANAIQSEINLMENLRHPNIVSLLGTQRLVTRHTPPPAKANVTFPLPVLVPT